MNNATQPTNNTYASQASPAAAYARRVASGQLQADAAQQQAALRLESLFRDIIGLGIETRASWWHRLWGNKSNRQHGLYLYGDVGRGKSMLMDIFFAELPLSRKKRIHFHAFMLDIHKRLHAFRTHDANGDGDALPRVIADLASQYDVLCLDEFQVSDVTDAMILARLFTGLFAANMWVVMTSNRQPRDLYQGGLQREQFLRFVDLVEARMDMVALQSPHDYRLAQLSAMKHTFVYPLGEAADQFLLTSWQQLTGQENSRRLDISVDGRVLRIDKHYSGVAWLTFDELCARPLGARDYIELARLCHTILLQSIPALTREDRNEAKRFVTLIDTLYEQKVKLLATAAVAPDKLYPAGDGSFEFHRTVSRLVEMQTAGYLALPHIG